MTETSISAPLESAAGQGLQVPLGVQPVLRRPVPHRRHLHRLRDRPDRGRAGVPVGLPAGAGRAADGVRRVRQPGLGVAAAGQRVRLVARADRPPVRVVHRVGLHVGAYPHARGAADHRRALHPGRRGGDRAVPDRRRTGGHRGPAVRLDRQRVRRAAAEGPDLHRAGLRAGRLGRHRAHPADLPSHQPAVDHLQHRRYRARRGLAVRGVPAARGVHRVLVHRVRGLGLHRRGGAGVAQGAAQGGGALARSRRGPGHRRLPGPGPGHAGRVGGGLWQGHQPDRHHAWSMPTDRGRDARCSSRWRSASPPA